MMNEIHMMNFCMDLCAERYKQRIDHNFLLDDFEKVCEKTRVDCLKEEYKQFYFDLQNNPWWK